MNSIWFFIVVVLAGIALGYALPASREQYKTAWGAFINSPAITSITQKVSLYALMLLMGFKLGLDEDLPQYIAWIGFQAFILAVAVIAGSVTCTLLLQYIFLRSKRLDVYYEEVDPKKDASFTMTIAILIVLFLGIMLSRLFPYIQPVLYLERHHDALVAILLCAMIFAAGLDIGRQKSVLSDIRRSGWGILIVPFGVIVGSIVAAMVVGPILGISPLRAGASASGCGWYTLAGVYWADVDARLGALSFLVNLFRELLAFALTPLIARKWGPFAAVAPGGATAMDTTLPVILRATSPANAIVAFASGVLLTISVPALFSFFNHIL